MTEQKSEEVKPKKPIVKVFTIPGVPVLKASQAIQEEQASGGKIPYPYVLETIKDIHEPYHDRCIQLKALTTVGIGYEFLSGDSDDVTVDLQPPSNPESTFDEILMQSALDLESTGNAYLEAVRATDKSVQELYWIPSETVWMKERKDGKHQGFTQQVGMQTKDFLPFGSKDADKDHHELIHIKIPSAESRYYGVPDWIGAIGPVILSNNTTEYNARFFANNATPDWAFIISGADLDEDQEQLVRDFIETNLKGVENSRKILFMNIPDENVKHSWDQISGQIQEGDFLKLRSSVRDDIVSAHGVPPRLVGIVVSGQLGGGSEAKEQLKIFREIVSNPRKKIWEAALNSTLFLESGARIRFNELSILDEDEEEALSPIGPVSPEIAFAANHQLQLVKAMLLHGKQETR